MKYMPTGLTQEEQEQITDSVEVIRTEIQSANPRKGLPAINGTAQFGAAIATLVQFVGTILSFIGNRGAVAKVDKYLLEQQLLCFLLCN